MDFEKEKVIVVGASPKEDRYSFKAIQSLLAHGHSVAGVHPVYREVLGVPVFETLREAKESLGGLDTVTLYVNATRSSVLEHDLLLVKPQRVIFNPGAENPTLLSRLSQEGIETLLACTLVLLSTGQFS
ncbi:MAG: CoA-binding protein [Bdellovibrionales bacterium]|nr:CoA-binding protein [Bdellovibrionales bacterium]